MSVTDGEQVTVRLYSGWDATTYQDHEQAAGEMGLWGWFATLPESGVVTCSRQQAEFLLAEALYASQYNISNRGGRNPYGNEVPSASARRAALLMTDAIRRALSVSVTA